MKISIALATYNGEEHLKSQLESFCNQTVPPDELIISDDSSQDGTLETILAFKASSPFIVKIYQNESNLGYARNFERALLYCCGDLVFISDQDDIWYPKKIETTLSFMKENPGTMLAISDMEIGDQDAVPTGKTMLNNILSMGASQREYTSGCGTVVRKDLLKLALPIGNLKGIGHDTWLHLVAAALSAREIIPESLQCYRRHEKNVSNWLATSSNYVSPLHALQASGLKDATASWENQRVTLIEIVRRLSEREKVVSELGFHDRIGPAKKKLANHISALERRIDIANTPHHLRPRKIFRMWTSGDYEFFLNWKSAIKDLLRFRPKNFD